jgi:sugar/nucleoside kinase (ribokinase family)
MPLLDSVRIGTLCGTLKTRAAGGFRGQPYLAEILTLLEE